MSDHLDELCTALWAACFRGLEIAALGTLAVAGALSRAQLCRLLPERADSNVYTVIRRLIQRRVIIVRAGKSISVNSEFSKWQTLDGTLIFAAGSNAAMGLNVRLRLLRTNTHEGAPTPQVDAIPSKTDGTQHPRSVKIGMDGHFAGEEPIQEQQTGPAGSQYDSEEPDIWEIATAKLKAINRGLSGAAEAEFIEQEFQRGRGQIERATTAAANSSAGDQPLIRIRPSPIGAGWLRIPRGISMPNKTPRAR